MNFEHLISGNIGLVHLICSMLALILGSIVLFSTKGTNRHKQIGYFYVASMLAVNLTAFMLFRLFGSFGMFHWMAIISLLTILAGMVPMILKKPASYVSLHFGFMYWSVIGLYAAFVAETLVRIPDIVVDSGIPNSTFYKMIGIGIGITMTLGVAFFLKSRKKWEKFDKTIN